MNEGLKGIVCSWTVQRYNSYNTKKSLILMPFFPGLFFKGNIDFSGNIKIILIKVSEYET